MFKNVYNFKRFAISLLLSMNVISSGFFWKHTNGERCFLSQNQAVTASTTRAINSRAMLAKKNVPGYVCNHGSPRERDAAS